MTTPTGKLPDWAWYVVYIVLVFLFIIVYPIIFDGNPDGPEPTGKEGSEQP